VETAIRVANELLGVHLTFESQLSFAHTDASRILADGSMKYSRHIVICPRYSVQNISIVKRIVDKTVNILRMRPDYNLFEDLVDTSVYKN
jgi:hypothetical protein